MDITEIGGPLFFVFISLLFSAFFSGMEIAFISSNRLKVELDKSSGGIKGRLMTFFYSKESMVITSILVGNNLSLVVFGISSAKNGTRAPVSVYLPNGSITKDADSISLVPLDKYGFNIDGGCQ